MFSKSLLKIDAYNLDTLALHFLFLFLNTLKVSDIYMVFDNYKNALKEDYMTKNSNLNCFGLKWDASVSSGNIRNIGCAVNLFFFCISKFSL